MDDQSQPTATDSPPMTPEIEETARAMKHMTEAEVEEVKRAFHVFDSNDDGMITCDEVGTVFVSLGLNRPTPFELTEIIANVAENGVSVITYEKFLEMVARSRYNGEEVDGVMEAFKLLDRDSNGYITKADVLYVTSTLGEKLSPEDATEMIEHADIDGDGRMDYEEFVKMVQRIQKEEVVAAEEAAAQNAENQGQEEPVDSMNFSE